jgi:hypothetical protein
MEKREKTRGEIKHRELLARQKTSVHGRASASTPASPLDELARRIKERTKNGGK